MIKNDIIEYFCIITFESTHDSIQAEFILQQNNISARIIPLPNELSAGCGFSLRIEQEKIKQSMDILSNNMYGIKCYRVEKSGLTKRFYQINNIS